MGLFDVEYVRSYSLFGRDAGEQDSKSATCDCFGYEVKKSDPVGGPYFDDYSSQGYVSVNADPGRDFGPDPLLIAKESVTIGFLSFFGNQIVGRISFNKEGMNGIFESLACLGIAYDASVSVFDVKDIDGQSVFSRDGSAPRMLMPVTAKAPETFSKIPCRSRVTISTIVRDRLRSFRQLMIGISESLPFFSKR